MVGRFVTPRLVDGEFHSAPGDPGGTGTDSVPAEVGDGTHGRGQSDPEAEREREHQARAGGQGGVGPQWAVDAPRPGGGGNGDLSRVGILRRKRQLIPPSLGTLWSGARPRLRGEATQREAVVIEKRYQD